MDIEKPFWWDMPTWVVTAKPNSIEQFSQPYASIGCFRQRSLGENQGIERSTQAYKETAFGLRIFITIFSMQDFGFHPQQVAPQAFFQIPSDIIGSMFISTESP